MPRYTPQQRRRLVQQFESSGLTLAAFCRQRSVSIASLRSWRGQVQHQPDQAEPARPQWLAVELAPQVPVTPVGGAAYLVEAGPWRLHLPSGFVRDEVLTLLELLQHRQGATPC